MTTRTALYVVLFLLLGAVLASCTAFDLGDLVKVGTPESVQRSEGLSATLSLNDAEHEYRKYFENVQADLVRWRSEIERADQVAGMIGQLTLNALDQAGPMIAGVPVLGSSLPVVAGLVGLALGRGNLRKEKEKSYNAGQLKASDIIRQTTPKA